MSKITNSIVIDEAHGKVRIDSNLIEIQENTRDESSLGSYLALEFKFNNHAKTEELRQAYDDYVQNKISKLNLTDISAHVSHTQTGSWFWKKQVYTIAIAWTKPLEPTEN
ncbi:MAG: hypothetical protein ACI9TY_000091 [Alphaproteobacteria bacterium]|jgi:hypothetical protein